jgi:hypothetical protein
MKLDTGTEELFENVKISMKLDTGTEELFENVQVASNFDFKVRQK